MTFALIVCYHDEGIFLENTMTNTELATRTKTKVKEPKLWNVVLHNDNVTTMEFVLQVLVEIFDYNEADAMALMLRIHEQGAGIAGTYVYEIAEHKAEHVMAAARKFEFPLAVTIEEED